MMTVTGPGAASGVVLMHEHCLFSYPGDDLDPTSTWTRDQAIEIAVERLRDLTAHGVTTIVDATTYECGRDPLLLQEISERSGMQIVCSTGFYHEKIGIPYYWRSRSAEEVAELYLHELTHGISGTGIKAGVIKIASCDPVGKHDRVMIEAAGIAMRESGAGAITHCENANGWDVQLEILERAGADLSRVMIGHQNQQLKMDALRAIARSGASIGMDRIGFSMLASDDTCADMIAQLVEEGSSDRVCIATDHASSVRSARFPYGIPAGSREMIYEQIWPSVREEFIRPRTFLFTEFLPKLEQRGVSQAVIDRILRENPLRILGDGARELTGR